MNLTKTRVWWKTLPELTDKIMREHYARNLDFVMQYMSPDVMWIGAAESQYMTGRENIRSHFESELEAACEVLAGEYALAFISEETCTVAGRLRVQTRKETGPYLEIEQRVTVQYVICADAPLVVHMHISNIWDDFKFEDMFPYRAGRETYQYVQERLKRGENFTKLWFNGRKHGRHFLYVDEILYIAAKRDYCMLYSLDGCLEITESISELASRLPEQFLPVHRSYIVNLNYIAGMERSVLTLCDGIKVPVPDKRYTQVKARIMEWMETRQTGFGIR